LLKSVKISLTLGIGIALDAIMSLVLVGGVLRWLVMGWIVALVHLLKNRLVFEHLKVWDAGNRVSLF